MQNIVKDIYSLITWAKLYTDIDLEDDRYIVARWDKHDIVTLEDHYPSDFQEDSVSVCVFNPGEDWEKEHYRNYAILASQKLLKDRAIYYEKISAKTKERLQQSKNTLIKDLDGIAEKISETVQYKDYTPNYVDMLEARFEKRPLSDIQKIDGYLEEIEYYIREIKTDLVRGAQDLAATHALTLLRKVEKLESSFPN